MTHIAWHILTLAVAALVALSSCAQDTPAWVPDGYAPCTHEDSPGPCYWDARERGNGQGTSFHVDASGAYTYVYE